MIDTPARFICLSLRAFPRCPLDASLASFGGLARDAGRDDTPARPKPRAPDVNPRDLTRGVKREYVGCGLLVPFCRIRSVRDGLPLSA
jgi:hypothetical protein